MAIYKKKQLFEKTLLSALEPVARTAQTKNFCSSGQGL